jgi:hypothetical protein
MQCDKEASEEERNYPRKMGEFCTLWRLMVLFW